VDEIPFCYTADHLLYLFASRDLLWNLTQSLYLYAAGVASGVIGLIITHVNWRALWR
jgi:hypothetical protein